MLSSQVSNHLKEILPKYADLFSKVVEVSSVNYVIETDITTVTCVTDELHYLEQEYQEYGDELSTEDRYIYLSNVLVGNKILSIESVSGIATIELENRHSYANYLTDIFYIQIIDSDEEAVNGRFKVSEVIDNYNIKVILDTNYTGTPTGNMFFLEENNSKGYEGYHKVTEIVDDKTFKFVLPFIINGDAFIDKFRGDYIKCHVRIFVSGFSSLRNFIACVSKSLNDEFVEEGKWKCGVIVNPPIASKSAYSNSDSMMGTLRVDEYRQTIVQNMNIVMMCPLRDETSGMLMNERLQILRSYVLLLAGRELERPSLYEGNSLIQPVYIGENINEENDAYCIYSYNFQSIYELLNKDVYLGNRNYYPITEFTNRYKDKLNVNILKEDRSII